MMSLETNLMSSGQRLKKLTERWRNASLADVKGETAVDTPQTAFDNNLVLEQYWLVMASTM